MEINLSKSMSPGMPKVPKSAQNALVEVVLLIVVCGLFTWFIILPKKAEISAKNASLAKVVEQESTVSGDLAKLQSMIQTLNSSSNQVADLDQALPLDGNTVNLQILINSLAQSVGVAVTDVEVSGQPNTVVAGDKALLSDPYGATRTLQTLAGNLSVTGSFAQLQAFLQKLETSARLIDVTDLEMDAAAGGNLSLRLGINAYYLAPSS
jgi:Tfp pilus assembly protein PilO